MFVLVLRSSRRISAQSFVRQIIRIGFMQPDRAHVVKLYGGYTFPIGTTLSSNVYAGSRTPLSTCGVTTNNTYVMVNGYADIGSHLRRGPLAPLLFPSEPLACRLVR